MAHALAYKDSIMNIVYQSDLVDLKIVQTATDGEVFYQVWKDGVICKQSESLVCCTLYVLDITNSMVESKLQALESKVYWTGQAYLVDHEDEQLNLTLSIDYNEAQQALRQFKDLLQSRGYYNE